jgi:hypothetical protein
MPVTISIKVDGNDVTDDVIIEQARFDYATDGNIGTAQIRVRDYRGGPYVPGYFKVGQEMTLDVDGNRVWGGYVMKLTLQYPFAATENAAPDEEIRYWQLDGNDYNILLRRRKLYNKEDPTKQMKIYKATDSPTDKEIIQDMVNLYLDLDGDGFEAGTGGDVINLDNVIELGELYWVAECAEEWQAASPGMDWADGMRSVCEWSGGVFYVGPATPNQSFKGPVLYYHDVNTATGPYELNDRPASDPGSAGVRNFNYTEDSTEQATEALVWGAGQGSQDMVFWRETATSEQGTYGTWQWGDFHQSMYLEECVKHRAKTYIHGSRLSKRGHKKPKDSWDVTIFTPDFKVGDVVDVHSYVHDVTDTVPIRRYQVSFPTHEEAQFDLHLSHYYDTAYSTYMWWEQPAPAGPWHEEYRSFGDVTGGTITWGGVGWIRSGYGEGTTIFDGVSDKLLDYPLDFLGTNTELGSFFARGLPGTPWYSPSCCCGIGVGCWGCDTYQVNQLWVGFNGLNAATTAQLYIDGARFARSGVGGDVTVSIVQDFDLEIEDDTIVGGGYGSAFYAWPEAGQVPGTPIEAIEAAGPLVDPSDPPYYHWWSGYWGSYNMSPPIIIPGELMRLTQSTAGYSNPQNIKAPQNWLVFTPIWRPSCGVDRDGQKYCGNYYYCDNSYVGLPAKGQGPPHEGFGMGGSADGLRLYKDIPGNIGSYGTGFFWINPWNNEYDQGLDYNEWGDGRYYSPSPEAEGYFYTRYPYLPGTLSVSVNGQQLVIGQEYWETNPPTGQFRINLGGSLDGMLVRYRIADPTASPNSGWDGFYFIPPDGGGHYLDIPGGRYYRPRYRSQVGWGTQWDSYNCTPAAACHFIDRSTLGAKQPTPPEVNAAMQSIGVWHGYSGASISDAAAVIRTYYKQYVLNPGIVNWTNFVNLIAEGRGAQLTGNSSALIPWGLNAPATGFHALYVNEVRSDGYLFVYDSAFSINKRYGITPGWYPPAAIQAYAAARSGSTNRVWAIYTRRTPRL